MFSSLRVRLWLSYAFIVVTALGAAALILFFYLLQSPLLYRQTVQNLKAAQTLVVKRGAEQPLESAAREAAESLNVRVLLFASDRRLMWDTAKGQPPLAFPRRRLLSQIPVVRDSDGAAWLYSLEKLPDKTFLLVTAPRPRVSIANIFADDFLPAIVQSGLLALALSLALAFLVSRWIADPLQKIVAAARESQTAEISLRGPQEVRELTRAYNSMVTRAQASQQSQRDFVANVSHELKTPLTSIQGFAQAILDGTAETDEARRHAAQIIYDEAARMYRMAADLLDLAKLEAGTAEITMSSVYLPALLNAVAEKFAPQSQRAGVRIVVAAQENLPKITADGDRLSQVFVNLTDNALKFTPRGGTITLRASLVSDGGQAKPKAIAVSVEDTGEGIAPDALPRVFERFYQADLARKGGKQHGAGLGLAIAREIVHAHGGKINVRSELGQGTVFEVILPYNKGDSRL